MTTDDFIDSIIPSKWEYEYADLVKVVLAERNACAKLCEAQENDGGEWDIQQQCANAIRARGGDANTM